MKRTDLAARLKFGAVIACVGLITGLGTRPVLAAAALGEQTQDVVQDVRVSFVRSGWKPTPFEFWKGGLFFKASVAGKMVWVLLDSGAEQTVISTRLAGELGLQSDTPAGSMRTISGTLPMAVVRNVPFEVPQQFAFKAHMAGADLGTLSAQLGRDIGVILGSQYLENMAYFIDTGNRTIYFVSSGTIVPKRGAEVPLVDRNMIDVNINGFSARLRIDTGHNGVVQLSERAWKRAIPADAIQGTLNATDAGGVISQGSIARSMRLKVGSIATVEAITTQHKDVPGADGYIGMGYFRNFNTLIDAPAGKIVLITPAATAQKGN